MSALRHVWSQDSPALLLIARLIATGLGFLSAPILARLLGPAGRGDTAAAATVLYVVPIAIALGVPTYVRRAVAISGSLAPIRAARHTAWLALLPSIAAAWLCFATVFASMGETARVVASLAVLSAPCAVSWACDIGALVAQTRFRALFVLILCPPVINLAGTLILWGTGTVSVASVVGVGAVANVATCAVGLGIVRLDGQAFDSTPSVKEMYRHGLRYSGAAFAEAALNRGDQVIMLPILGASQAGLYAVAASISTLPVTVGHALASNYFGVIARTEGRALRDVVSTALRSALVLSLAVTVALIALTPLAVPAIFGSEFRAAVPVTLVSIAATVPLILGFVAGNMLAAMGRGLTLTAWQLVAAGLGLGLLFPLGTVYGAMGAALASVIAYATSGIAMIIAVRPHATFMVIGRADIRVAASDILRRKGA